MKYTGHILMDDTGIKEQQMLTDKLRASLEEKYGPGQINTNVSADNLRALKYAYVTDNDETPAPTHPEAVNGETEKPVELGGLDVEDPATEEIEEEREEVEDEQEDA